VWTLVPLHERGALARRAQTASAACAELAARSTATLLQIVSAVKPLSGDEATAVAMTDDCTPYPQCIRPQRPSAAVRGGAERRGGRRRRKQRVDVREAGEGGCGQSVL